MHSPKIRCLVVKEPRSDHSFVVFDQRQSPKYLYYVQHLSAEDDHWQADFSLTDQRILWAVAENLYNIDFSVERLAACVYLSSAQLYRKVARLSKLPPSQFIRMSRLHYALLLLDQPQVSIRDIAYYAGFADANYFSRCFKQAFGFTPKEWQNMNDLCYKLPE